MNGSLARFMICESMITCVVISREKDLFFLIGESQIKSCHARLKLVNEKIIDETAICGGNRLETISSRSDKSASEHGISTGICADIDEEIVRCHRVQHKRHIGEVV